MKEIIREADALIEEMNALEEFNDDLFIQFFEKEEKMQDRLEAMEKKGELSAQELKECSERLAGAFGRLKSKLSFCNL